MRLFIAVDLDAPARAGVAAAVARLRDRAERERRGVSRGVSWVDAHNLHLTLHFLGEIADERVPALQAALAPALPLEAARIGFGGFGVFPPQGLPRVIWIGITGAVPTLALAHAAIGDRLTRMGVAIETRPWSPHLTIGRVKVPSGQVWNRLSRELAPGVEGECAVAACTLYRSRLAPGGPTYEALMSIPFAAAAGAAGAGLPEGPRAT